MMMGRVSLRRDVSTDEGTRQLMLGRVSSGERHCSRNSSRNSIVSIQRITLRDNLPENRFIPYDVIGVRLQGWRIRGFEGARAPPRRQKHPLEIKEKLHKTLCNTKIQ